MQHASALSTTNQTRWLITAEHDCKSEQVISKAQRRYTVGYLPNGKDTPEIKLSGKWLREEGFKTGTGFTVKVSDGCLMIIADSNEVRELRQELYQVQQVVKGMEDMLV